MARRKRTQLRAEAIATAAVPSETQHPHALQLSDLVRGVCRVLGTSMKLMEGGLALLITTARQNARRLHLANNAEAVRVSHRVSLGEKRFVAVLLCDGERFLVGGGANSVAMLARLKSPKGAQPSFAEVLDGFDSQRLTIQ